jgi:hypothetical protein
LSETRRRLAVEFESLLLPLSDGVRVRVRVRVRVNGYVRG